MPKRIRKHHVIAVLKVSNKSYRQETGSHRGIYMIQTLRKAYNPATESYTWGVVTNFNGNYRSLGGTLREAYERLTS